MKRCPECRRDYYDDTLLYCLEDGNELVQGAVPSPDEPATAILSEPPALAGGQFGSEAATRAQIHTKEQTAIFPRGAEAEPQSGLGKPSEKHSFSANRAAKPLAALIVAVLILVGGFFGYKYFSPTKQIESIAVMPFVKNLKKAIEQFKAATDRDPNYALAYAGLADCYVVLPEYAGTPLSETIPQAKVYAERAIAIDDQLAEPHVSLAALNRQLWQWTESEKEFKRAIELNPNYATAHHWYSILLRDLGRFDEAALTIKRAKEIDPLSSVIGGNISLSYQIQNNHNASIENSLKVIELDPYFSGAYRNLGLSYLKQGRNAEAIANLEKAVELSNRGGGALPDLGYGYGVAGKRTEANAIVKELEEKYARKESNGQSVAAVYAGLGEKDKAFEWLEKDFRTKGELANISWGIPFESLRDDPRFKDLLKRMGLEP